MIVILAREEEPVDFRSSSIVANGIWLHTKLALFCKLRRRKLWNNNFKWEGKLGLYKVNSDIGACHAIRNR
jgi:hypothetical protein